MIYTKILESLSIEEEEDVSREKEKKEIDQTRCGACRDQGQSCTRK